METWKWKTGEISLKEFQNLLPKDKAIYWKEILEMKEDERSTIQKYILQFYSPLVLPKKDFDEHIDIYY